MSDMSDYLEDSLLTYLDTLSPSMYVALYNGSPGDGGTGGSEIAGPGYSRQSVSFNAVSSGTRTSSGAVSFTASGGDWGVVTHLAIFDASSAGNLLWHRELDSYANITDGDTFQIAAGDLWLSLR